MATKTFEELKQMAIQIRDEKANKQNTATRIGTQMLEHLNKLEQDFLDKDTTEGKFSELEGGINSLYYNKIDIKPGANLLDIDKCIKGFYIASENGRILENENYYASPFIPFKKEYGSIVTNQNMSGAGAGHAVYDSNFNFIRGFKNTIINWLEGDAYVRFSCKNLPNVIVNAGDTLYPNEPYNPIGGYLNTIKEEIEKVDEKVDEKANKKAGKNLLDENAIQKIKYIDNTGQIVGGNENYSVSDYIPVEGDTDYFLSNKEYSPISNRSDFYISFYDADKVYLSCTPSNVTLIHTPSDAAFMRCSIVNALIDNMEAQIERGNNRTDYIKYSPVGGYTEDIWEIKDNSISPIKTDFIEPSDNLFNKNTAIIGAYIKYNVGSLINGEGWAASDFIAIKGNTVYSGWIRDYAFYDEKKRYISGDSTPTNRITSPIDAKYIRFSLYSKDDINSVIDNCMFNLGSDIKKYKPFMLRIPNLEPISPDNTTFIEFSNNLFNYQNANLGYYIDGNTGEMRPISDTGDVSGWIASDYIKIKGSTKYAFRSATHAGRDRAYYDINYNYISGASDFVEEEISPANAAYIRVSFYNVDINSIMINEGEALPFEPFGIRLPNLLLPKEELTIDINLPDKIYAIVGDTLQLFYRGMIKAVNPYIYDIVVNCSVGKAFPRYFQLDAGSAGSYNFELKVKDNNGNILGNKSCKIEIKEAVKAPTNNLNILIIGDSLTNARIYPKEAYRRLCKTGGVPTGLGYNNINFVGRKKVDIENTTIGVEGNSGWSWSSYLTKGRKAITFTINQPSIMPTVESVYKDTNNKQYTMWWDYSNTSVKMLVNDMTSTPPSSGTLTKVSGTGDDIITYSSIEESSGNPFWNDNTEQLDIRGYVNKWCNGNLDVVYCLLTWNGQTANRTDFSSFIEYARTLFNHIKDQYPNIKIKMLGVQLPDLRYGQKVLGAPRENSYTDCYGLSVTALNMNNAYQNFCNEEGIKDYVEFVNVSSQVDSEYNMPFTEVPVNTRNSKYSDKVGTNDVHPNEDGYNQIADVVFRNFVANFCQ